MTATLPDSLTAYQRLAIFNEETGLNIRLRPFESVLKVGIGDTDAVLLLETHRYEERSREYRLTARYRKMISVSIERGYEELLIEDDEFPGMVIKKFEFSKTADVQREQREWERMCHRPAGDRDSHSRLAQGYVGGAPKGAVR